MSKQWFYRVMGEEIGPISSAELKHRVKQGQIGPDSELKAGPTGKWGPAARVKGLFTPVPTAPAPQPEKMPQQSEPSQPQREPSDDSVLLGEPAASESDTGIYTLSGIHAAAAADDTVVAPNHDPEFFDFVGYEQAITTPLYRAVQQYRLAKGLTMTRLNRLALAEYIGRPELAEEPKPNPEPSGDGCLPS